MIKTSQHRYGIVLKNILAIIIIYPCISLHSFAENHPEFSSLQFSGWMSVASKDIGTIGIQADKHPVTQFYGAAQTDQGFYAALWANMPLDSDNPYKSKEVDLIFGVNKTIADIQLDISFALYDLEKPDLGDFNEDVVTTRIMLGKDNYYVESYYYDAMGKRNGWLTAAGATFDITQSVNLSASLNHTSGPFGFKTVTFVKSILTFKEESSPLSLHLEFTDQLYRQDSNDPRRFAMLVGMRYDF